MWYIVACIIAVAGMIVGLISIVKASAAPEEEIPAGQRVDHRGMPVNPPDSITGSYSRDEVQKKLKKLASSPAPAMLKPGAMCYSVAMPPDSAEYVCPKCGEKTFYTESYVYMVKYDIPSCRSAVKTMPGLKVELDESEFCRKCSPAVKSPALCMKIHYEGEATPHKTCGVSSDDMTLMYEFLNGEKKHQGGSSGEIPLKNYTNRLETLLGIKIKE